MRQIGTQIHGKHVRNYVAFKPEYVFGFGLFACMSVPLHAVLGVEWLELGADFSVSTEFFTAFGMVPHPFLLIFFSYFTKLNLSFNTALIRRENEINGIILY